MGAYKKIVFNDAHAVFHFSGRDVQLLLDAVRQYISDAQYIDEQEDLRKLHEELRQGFSAINMGASAE